MKNLKINAGVLALLLGFTLAFTSAFTAKQNFVFYHLKADMTSDDILQAESYEEATGSESCSSGPSLPCIIKFDADEFDNLEEYLDSRGTIAAVRDNAYVTRAN